MRFNLADQPTLTSAYRILQWDLIKNLKALPVLNNNGAQELYRKIAWRLVKTCLIEDGIGIAASQVGIFKRLFLIREFDQTENGEAVILPSFKLFLNPKWVGVAESGKTIDDEYCLSVSGPGIPIERFNKIEATWTEFDKDGKFILKSASLEGRMAQIYAHESDHLLGISIPQRYEMQNTSKKKPKKKKRRKRKKR